MQGFRVSGLGWWGGGSRDAGMGVFLELRALRVSGLWGASRGFRFKGFRVQGSKPKSRNKKGTLFGSNGLLTPNMDLSPERIF